jgi:hypothetical protein
MQRYYSPSAGGFFSEDVHGPRLIADQGIDIPNPSCLIPEDAVAIDDDHWIALLIGTSEGKRIAMIDGHPQAIDPESEGGA